eukprot:25586-Eustigmatos_ZCMA.PRE.1
MATTFEEMKMGAFHAALAQEADTPDDQLNISQTPPVSQSKRRRSEKLEPVRRSLFTDVGFAEDRP